EPHWSFLYPPPKLMIATEPGLASRLVTMSGNRNSFRATMVGRDAPSRAALSSQARGTSLNAVRKTCSEDRGRDLVDRGHDVVDVRLRQQRMQVDVDGPSQDLVGPRELALPEGRLALVVRALPGAVTPRQKATLDELVEVIVDVLPAGPGDRGAHVLGGQRLSEPGRRFGRRHGEDQRRARVALGIGQGADREPRGPADPPDGARLVGAHLPDDPVHLAELSDPDRRRQLAHPV